MDNSHGSRQRIIDKLLIKANLQQRVFDNTFAAFNDLKDILHEMSSELNDELEETLDKRVRITYQDRGKFEAQLQVASDVLIFSMHTNVFNFNSEHPIWQNPYVQQNKMNAYCGIINIYDFLADSLKFNRMADEGYLIGRIFINHESKFFVEGKRQCSMKHDMFGSAIIDRQYIGDIVGNAINYSLDFDLLAPPYDLMKIVSVDQLSTKTEHSRIETGKRLGYEFNSDDI